MSACFMFSQVSESTAENFLAAFHCALFRLRMARRLLDEKRKWADWRKEGGAENVLENSEQGIFPFPPF